MINPIYLNYVFNNNDILDAWIQEREQLVLREDDLYWLGEGISQSEKEVLGMVVMKALAKGVRVL